MCCETYIDFEKFLCACHLLEKKEKAEWFPKDDVELELAEKMVKGELSERSFDININYERKSVVVTRITATKGVKDESENLFRYTDIDKFR